ncbi:MAG: hypothetical protein LQ345_001993 [Seirophora villosa]|nr:MAG: hypothetical protein LQ345_001993 [Seirophora villosa]
MTAVVSPSSVQPHTQWNPGDAAQGGLHAMNADDVTRIFMPRKSAQRTNSSSSTASSSSSASSSSTFTVPVPSPQPTSDISTTTGDQGALAAKKKPARSLWPSSKAEPVSALSNGRPPPLSPSSGQSAASAISAMHQPSPILPSQNRSSAQQQQNGGRMDQSPSPSEAPAVLALQPLTGTFERKQINVPYYPEVLRIGRQTNAKTVPTATNGYFDSKVLSRQHAEVWADRNGKIWIRDVKSSNGTFINGARLSAENRDSDPHELNQSDTLELGIDIVSEDQKSIVHHKVSAKVEHAGVYGTGTSVLDLNFGDMDPNAGSALMGQPMSHSMSHLRGRGTSQGSMGSNGRLTGPSSVANGGPNGMAQRQMNLWMNPITIEQVVKRLATELKQAKQQSQDLHRTGDFFTTLLLLNPGEEMPKPPEGRITDVPQQPNGISHAAPFVDALLPFSQPPAPPPQQPLPEKPDVARLASSDSLNQPPLRRTETERPKSFSNSPSRPEPHSSHIISLVEALNTAKKEIDSQGDRVKQLESLLKREKKARESAEERARRLLAGQSSPDGERRGGAIEHDAFDPPMDTARELSLDGEPIAHSTVSDCDQPDTSILATSPESPEEIHRQTEDVDASTTRLRKRLEQMVHDMDQMKTQMENYKRRAEGAEAERTSLAEMIEKLRGEAAGKETFGNGNIIHPSKHTSTRNMAGVTSSPAEPLRSTSGLWNGTSSTPSSPSSSLHDRKQPNGTITASSTSSEKEPPSNMQALERSMAATLHSYASGAAIAQSKGGREAAMQSAPYVSMVGVVLIGVGLMTWLNGWQKVER